MTKDKQDLSPTAKVDAKLKATFILAQTGDKLKYQEFLEQTQELLRKYLYSTSIIAQYSQQEKDEILQDILIKIHAKKHTYQSAYPITPWLYQIAKNTILDFLRAKKSRITFKEIQIHEFNNVEDQSFSMEAKAAFKDELIDLLDNLSEKQRESLILSKGYGFTAKEISKITNSSVSAVKISIFRALSNVIKSKDT